MNSESSLRIMLPVAALPDEAANWLRHPLRENPGALASWLAAELSAVELRELVAAGGDEPVLQMIEAHLHASPNTAPFLLLGSAAVSVQLGTSDAAEMLASGVSERADADVVTWLRDTIAASCQLPASRLVVLLAGEGAGATGGVRFLGAAVRPEGDASWDIVGGQAIVAEPEVEGRGLRSSVTIAGFLLSIGQSAASAFPRSTTDDSDVGPVQELVDILAVDSVDDPESPKPTVITVTSQELTQSPPTMDERALAMATGGSVRIVVDLSAQRAYLLVDGIVAIDTPVSTARAGKKTPLGTFRITQKVERNKISTIYGVELPYWMRLNSSDIGFHVGRLPGEPASAGCIRIPEEVAKLFFRHAPPGTPVQVIDRWVQ